MSNVIDFLEKMGRDAQLRHGSPGDVELALAGTQVEPELQSAILAGDSSQLQELLGQKLLFCIEMPSKEEEDEDGDAEESPSQEDGQMVLQPLFRSMSLVV